jgi:hypothetical protein
MAQQKLSPDQRARMFSQMTRKYEQVLPSEKFKENSTLSFQLPKTRFLSKITLHVRGTFKTAHGSKTSFTKSIFDKFNLVRRVRLSINNGFNPYDISGNMLSLYNKANHYQRPDADVFDLDVLGNVVSVSGTTNTVTYALELPISLNDRDPIGLLLLQNEQSIVTLNVDTSSLSSIMTDNDITISDDSIYFTPVLETFSIPLIPDAIPDYSIVKLVNEQSENIVSTNEMIVKLPLGLTYRKLGVYLASDTAYTPIPHANISGFQLIFNQADTPINVSSDHVARKNRVDYDGSMPVGSYMFDFSSQGIANLGGGRDYVDTERLTECWLKVQFSGLSGASNYIHLFSEKLAKLQ